ncbi:uncharacterized protein LOC123536487 [Mercenaria mercenaria]|uniref:uncharacterized protein LOC123536487 n=1 Tax=Mercenaria mercenaria TaxID=6596 RepID=UPI00234FA1E8|nr:uncharacterized protein LOC123536487 [Mercenaria mercenaria]
MSRNHILLKGDKMPATSQKPCKSKIGCSELCPQHPQEVIIYYCRTHDDVGCHMCIADKHSFCKDEIISDILKDVGIETECKNFIKDLEDVGKQAGLYKKQGQEDKGKIDNCNDAAIQQMKSFRKDITSSLDQMKSSLTSEATRKQDAKSEIDKLISECDCVTRETEQLKTEIEKSDRSKMFVLMKLNKDKIKICKTALRTLTDGKNINTISFEPNKTLQSIHSFGEINIKTEIMATKKRNPFDIVATTSTPVSVKSDSDKRRCEINGITVVSTDEIAVADTGNKTVKFIDVKENKVISELIFPTAPWGLTMVTPKTLAVTLPYSQEIQILSKCESWQKDHHIKVRGYCYGIAKCSDGNIVVSLKPSPRVEILRQNGAVLKTFKVDSKGFDIFRDPQYLAVDVDEKNVYVSDVVLNKVAKLSLATGEITALHSSHGVSLYGIAVTENGDVLVCDIKKSKSNVYMFSDDLSNSKIMLGKNDGLIKWIQEDKLAVDTEDVNDLHNLKGVFNVRFHTYKPSTDL